MSKTKPVYLIFSLLLLTFLALPSGGQAQTSAAWTQLGSLPAGTLSLASDGSKTGTVYAYGSSGIQRSTDNGVSWTTCNREARNMFAVTPLPGTSGSTALYAATTGGLRISDDGCNTWRDIPSGDIAPSSAHIRWLAPYPNNYSILYAGMDGLGGIYRSTDTGAHWQAASGGLPAGAWVTSLTADPVQPSNVLISVRYTGRNQPPAYIYRSTDGGINWKSSGNGIYITPDTDVSVVGLAWSGGNLLAATAYNGLYVSTDRGATWSTSVTPRSNAGASSGAVPRIDGLTATTDGTLVLGTSDGAYASYNGGLSWQGFGPGQATGKLTGLYVDRNSGRVLLGSGSALYTYLIPSGQATLATPTPVTVPSATPTPPIAPQVPTATPIPPTATATITPTPIPPSPTVPVINGKRPTDPTDPTNSDGTGYFTQTKHNVGPIFLAYWNANGGVGQFGYPLSELFEENGVSVQYFERARLELRDGAVQLGRLGVELTQGQFFRPLAFFPSTDNDVFFGATNHSVEGPFLDFWRTHGRDVLLGYPISESFKEDGSEYQWFERGRLEWHPYLPEGERIVLGNVGTLLLQGRGWIQ